MATRVPADSYQHHGQWLVVRPEISWLREVGLAAFWTALIALGSWLPARGPAISATTRTLLIGIVGAFIVLDALRLYMISRVSSLRVDRETLIFINALGLSRELPPGALRKIVMASFSETFKYRAVYSYYLFLDQHGRALLALPMTRWPEEGIDAVGQALGVLVTGTFSTLTGSGFRRQYPGSISWLEAHPIFTWTLLIITAIVGLAVLIALVQG